MLSYKMGRRERRLVVYSNGIYVQWTLDDMDRAQAAGLLRRGLLGLCVGLAIWVRLLPQVLRAATRRSIPKRGKHG